MHQAYNTYTMDVIEALVVRTGCTVHNAKLFLVNRLETLYTAYLNTLPTSDAIDRLLAA